MSQDPKMATHFHAPSPWSAIKTCSKGARAFVAVPFLGVGAADMLPISEGSVLVTRFTQEAVKAGQVDPREVVKLLRRGVAVFSRADLHAKIYAFPRRVFVGSANVSKTSEGLQEACIESTESEIVRQARDYVRSIASDLVTLEYAKSLVDDYPKDGERYMGVARKTTRQSNEEKEQFWVISVQEVSLKGHVREADRAGSKRALEAIASNKTSLEKLVWDGPVIFRPGDWVMSRYAVGRGYEFSCPERVIHIESVPLTEVETSIVYLERIKRQRRVMSTDLRRDHPDLVPKLCVEWRDAQRKVTADRDVVAIKQLWPVFRA